MLMQYWFSSENMPVTEFFGNVTVWTFFTVLASYILIPRLSLAWEWEHASILEVHGKLPFYKIASTNEVHFQFL